MNRTLVFFSCMLAGYLILLQPHINEEPVHRYEQTDIPQYLGTAVQHVERGLGETYGRDYKKDRETRYLNHPGLLSLILSVPVRIIGPSNALARSLPMSFNLITVGLLMFVVARENISWWKFGMVFFTMPIIVRYGRDLVIYSPVLLLTVLTLLLYFLWRDKMSRGAFYTLLFMTTFVAASFDWIGYLLFPLVFSLELQSKRKMPVFVLLIVAAAAALAIFSWQNFMIAGSILGPFSKAFLQGQNYEEHIVESYREAYNVGTWFLQQVIFLTLNFSGPALITALLGMLNSAQRIWSRHSIELSEKIAWGSLAVGVGFIFLTAPWAYVHGYLQLLLIPAVLLFSLHFFQHVSPKYVALSYWIYALFSIPVSTFLIFEYYSHYI